MTADSVAIPAPLLDRLATRGVPVEAVLRQVGLPPRPAPGTRVTTATFFALWRALEAVVPAEPEYGLALGSDAIAHRHHVPSIAALRAPNLGEALKVMGRYKRLVCPEQVEIERGESEGHREAGVRFHWILADAGVPRLLVDATFASLLAVARIGTGKPVSPRRIELARRPAQAAVFRAHFGCEVRFRAAFDRIVFAEDTLAVPFAARDDGLGALLPDLEAELAGHGPGSLSDDVRMAIARGMCARRPSVDKIARRLRTSPRTLQRRLADEGTSYQELLDEVRRKTARRLLADTDLDPVDVAFLLGFEEPNSFARAFRGWEGTTAVRWRSAEAG